MAFCAESTEPVPYDDEEFPQWTLDLRRFEVVSLGSVPFAMIGVTMAYGAIEMNRGNINSMPNPLNPGSFSEGEQLKIVGMTLCVGACIGLIDFTVNKIRRYNQRKKLERINATKQINVIPVDENAGPEIIEDDTKSIEAEGEN